MYHTIDTIIVSVITIATAASSALLLGDAATHHGVQMSLVLLPLIGSLIVSGGLIMLNPEVETRRIVIGRAIFALFFGVVTPQIAGLAHPSLMAAMTSPMPLLMAGGIVSGLVYIMSKPFTRELYKRSGDAAKREVDRLEQLHKDSVDKKDQG